MKTRLTLICAVLFAAATNAQPGIIDETFGGNSGVQYINFLSDAEEWMTHMVVDQDDRIWMVGQTFADGDGKLLLVRLTPDGEYDESFAGTGHAVVNVGPNNLEIVGGIALQGNDLIIAGHTFSADVFTPFVVKYTQAGILDQSFGNFGLLSIPVDIPVNNVTTDDTGNIYLACTGDDNIVVLKVLPDGELDANFGFFGGTVAEFATTDEAVAIAVNSEGKIYVIGTADDSNQIRGTITAFLPNGAVDTDFGNNGRGVYSIQSKHFHLKDGLLSEDETRFYLAGQSEHTVTGAKDMAVTAVSSLGDPVFFAGGAGWLQLDLSIGGDEVANRIIESENGLFIACNVQEVPQGINSAVVHITFDGELVGSFAQGGVGTYNIVQNGDDQALGMGLQSDGKLILTGILLNPEVVQVLGYATRIETDLTIGIEDEKVSVELLVYPNPASDYLNILLTNQQTGGHTYRIHNANGQLIRQGVIQTTEERLDISSLSPGYYMMMLNNGGHTYFIKSN